MNRETVTTCSRTFAILIDPFFGPQGNQLKLPHDP